ncbi:hypothetical protein FISHEDRAFT_75619 [Fistulina hepatica ATCC 64428]|uniref:Uncharacterized protein n=1 Tax=Fistulina hepatica ATCC 64428 TaxID=1128425 RepID=A0A0D7A625_9AGAR|nr:hypothetical protein FISHEDRAFT_75619 [Fistulina hepatica ATCC 64428]
MGLPLSEEFCKQSSEVTGPRALICRFETADTLQSSLRSAEDAYSLHSTSFNQVVLGYLPNLMLLSQSREIALCLSAVGYAKCCGRDGVKLVCPDNAGSALILKHWTGSRFGTQRFVSRSVRPHSPAVYLQGQGTCEYIVCISPTSRLRVVMYQEDDDTWVPKTYFSRCVVHPEGRFGAVVDTTELIHVFFQDASGTLSYTRTSMTLRIISTSTPFTSIRPVVGSPISVNELNNVLNAFYISAADDRMHCCSYRSGRYSDAVVNDYCFAEPVQQFGVDVEQGRVVSVYVLSKRRELWQISADGCRNVLGDVDEHGGFVTRSAADKCCEDARNGTLTAERLEAYMRDNPFVINATGGDPVSTPLAAAIQQGRFHIVKFLLENGANPDALSPRRRTPLFFATTQCPRESRVAIVHALLDAGADIDQCYPEDDLNTPLMNAIAVQPDTDVVRELIAQGASLTLRNAFEKTAAMLAEGTELEKLEELRREHRPSTNGPSHVPNSFEKYAIELLFMFIALFISHTNAEDVLDQISGGLRNIEDQVERRRRTLRNENK